MRFRLRTLLIAVGVLPPLIAGLWFAGGWACPILLATVFVSHMWWEWFVIRRKSTVLRIVIATGLLGLVAGWIGFCLI